MSLGPILQRRNISDRQFTGDLSSLFSRHRIATGSACAFANFESRFALSEGFRSQLFTLCTAISHMSEADLTGGQLLALIACALNSSEPSDGSAELPERVRAEFEDGYDEWNARDLSKADEWQTRPQPTDFDPIPFSQSAHANFKRAGSGVGIPGKIMFQGPHDIGSRMSALEPPEVTGVDLDHLTLDELTGLLEKMEHRIGRLKRHIRPLVDVAAGREERPGVALEQVARSVPKSVHIDDNAFLARHPYLAPGRRVISFDRVLQMVPPPAIALEGHVHGTAVATAAGSPPPSEAVKTSTTAGLACTEAPEWSRDSGPTSIHQRAGRSRSRLRRAIGAIAGSVMFVIIVGGIAEIVLYPSAVATYFNQPFRVGPTMQKSSEITQVAANPGPLANATTNATRRAANAVSHRALSRIQWDAQHSTTEPAADGAALQPH